MSVVEILWQHSIVEIVLLPFHSGILFSVLKTGAPETDFAKPGNSWHSFVQLWPNVRAEACACVPRNVENRIMHIHTAII